MFVPFAQLHQRKKKKKENMIMIGFNGEDTPTENALFTVVEVKCHPSVFVTANLFKMKLLRSV